MPAEGWRKPVFVDEDTSWMDNGNCRGVDPEMFYPGRGESTREAKEVCAGCAVRVECLDYAFRHCERHGIWGGLSERERRRIRSRRLRGQT